MSESNTKDQFVDQLIETREKYRALVEPEPGTLTRQSEKELTKNQDFHKVVISTTLLNMIAKDGEGGFWPMIEILYKGVKGDVEKLLDFYEVKFEETTSFNDGETSFMPKVKLKSNVETDFLNEQKS